MWDHLTIWNSVAFVIAEAGLALLAWALFADRAKGRLRCPKCWYSLDGTLADDGGTRKCPECGHGNLRERSLKRTRRRWRYALLALLVFFFADQSRRIPAANEHGWVAFVPTTLIIPLAPIQSERWVWELQHGRSPFVETWSWIDDLRLELLRRDGRDECWRWQASAWADLAGLWGARNQRWKVESLAIKHLLDYPKWPSLDNLPSEPDSEQDLLALIEESIDPESWVDHGGGAGLAMLVGHRVLVINAPDTTTRVRALHDQLLNRAQRIDRLSTIDSAGSLSESEPSICLDFRPLVRARGMDGFATWSFTTYLSGQLSNRLYAEEWRWNGGDGLWMHWVGAHLVIGGRADLVERVRANLPECLRAALHNSSSADYRPAEEEPMLR